MNLAENIRFLRLAHNPRINSVAEFVEKLGITQKSISNYEQARCLPPTYNGGYCRPFSPVIG